MQEGRGKGRFTGASEANKTKRMGVREPAQVKMDDSTPIGVPRLDYACAAVV